ncbi:hypothetical protein [Anaerobacterium chartisolvens]|nr:hypothetical protein [Anaerobacterium chartisolvens]
MTAKLGTAVILGTTAGQTYYLKVVGRDGSFDADNLYRLYVYFKFPII